MSTKPVPVTDEHWMIQAAVDAAPELSPDTIDRLRRVFVPAQLTRPTPVTQPSRRAA
ncbi:hypothetical protein [Salinispora arenicola]|uniref:hypothetical protein n=1 Tax=Salinispora arenicola TaxID=168697 RepID=UPI0016933F38|nr:hypothetical protein [Salinispora arenicola]NIL57853.1 hypothetical protein [Salinispora arenicola]NIL62738.1 hypothetical protein [Salinispora arenicola]